MVRKLSERLYSEGEITVYNVDKNKIANVVEDAVREAQTYVNSGEALPTWHWTIGKDDDNYYELVLGFAEGYEPNEDEFCDSDGNHIEMKWAYIPKNSGMNEYDMDYMYPFDDETNECWDMCRTVYNYNVESDVFAILADFRDYANRVNSALEDEYYESVRRNKRSVIEASTNDFIYVIMDNGDPVAKGSYDAMIKKSYSYPYTVTIRKFPKVKLNSLIKMAKDAHRPDPLKFAVNRFINDYTDEYDELNS